jgi:hypothetical protein
MVEITSKQIVDDSTEDVVVVTARQTRRFDISSFRSEISKKGLLQNNRFVCIFAIPEGLRQKYAKSFSSDDVKYADSGEQLTLRCETVTIPGQNFFTQEIKRYGYGQIEKKPYLPAFNPMRMVFLVDRNAKVIEFFNDWVNLIVNHDMEGNVGGFNNDELYLVNHKNKYICPVIRIYVYDEFNEQTMECNMYDCFPLTMSDFDTTWTSQNDPIRLTVTMQFLHSSKFFYEKD